MQVQLQRVPGRDELFRAVRTVEEKIEIFIPMVDTCMMVCAKWLR